MHDKRATKVLDGLVTKHDLRAVFDREPVPTRKHNGFALDFPSAASVSPSDGNAKRELNVTQSLGRRLVHDADGRICRN
jgi:hypothetical protein